MEEDANVETYLSCEPAGRTYTCCLDFLNDGGGRGRLFGEDRAREGRGVISSGKGMLDKEAVVVGEETVEQVVLSSRTTIL